MQKILYLIIISFSLVSCYTYQVKKQAEPLTENEKGSKNKEEAANVASMEVKNDEAKSQSINSQAAPVPVNVQEKLTPNKNVKIDVDGKSYKIIVDRWESDSLVAHAVKNPKVVFKFHKNQINGEKIAEKRFSQPIADIITVTVYAGIGVGIWALLQQ